MVLSNVRVFAKGRLQLLLLTTIVWGIDREKDPFEIAHEAIKKTKDYFVAMGIPTTMREVGIKDETK